MLIIHHNKHSENYRYHVLRIGRLDFCNGCFANRIFLSLLLPIYLYFLMTELSASLFLALTSYMIFQIFLAVFMAITGRQVLSLFAGLITTIFVVGAHGILIFSPLNYNIPIDLLLLSIIALSIPQFGIYISKFITKKDFQYPIAKLLIRITFIHGYLCAVLLTRYDPIIGIISIVVTATLFAVVREFSSRFVKEDHSACLPKENQIKISNILSLKSTKLNKTQATLAVSMASDDGDCCQVCSLFACCICPCMWCFGIPVA